MRISLPVKLSYFNLIQRIADFIAIVLSFSIGFCYYYVPAAKTVPYTFFQFLGLGAFAGILFLAVFQSLRLYESKMSLLNVVETRRLILAWSLGSLILLGSTFYFRSLDLSRIMVTVSLSISIILLIGERSLVYHLQVRHRLKGGVGRFVAIYGAGIVGRHLYKRIYHSPGLGLQVAGFLDDDKKLWGQEIRFGEIRRKNGNVVIGGLEKLPSLVLEKHVKEVFVAIPNATYERNLEIVQECRKLGCSVSVVPPTYGRQMHSIEVEEIGGIPILREKVSEPHILYPALKRVIDLFVSLALLFILSPVIFIVVLIVKIDSPGPIIFRQKRVGLAGKEFELYKFRTMHQEANPYAYTPTSSEDSRITRFGRWLRRSSLDELPQLLNVLRGDMSMVGPRPEMPFIVAGYSEEQRERLKVKPGITGVWQISAVRGEPIHANMEYDLFYIEQRSLLLDVIIIFKTLVTAIRGIGAV
jgi:putative colanic acid biosynthesis UDP-glucose lipid carrier transferase